ncbi:hypothetical protein FFWV33_06610 [Flavobacterium faecale]|uniref:Uncharacterized protein n=2 Tax=Flavobacterium faecale TaxID=1355330 RepID=A0A2S1LC01_9FLAO|nr:hypothetical protein FFWV33_06610 [Flavobacterium faecale]
MQYGKLPLSKYNEENDTEIYYYPDINSLFWLELQESNEKILVSEIVSLIEKLNIKNLIFLRESNQQWISNFTKNRKDFIPLIKAVNYFSEHKIKNKYNGGVKVNNAEFETFIENFYILTRCDSGFFDFNFIDENENYLFYLHYSGDLRIITLNRNANQRIMTVVHETKLVDSMREDSSRIESSPN